MNPRAKLLFAAAAGALALVFLTRKSSDASGNTFPGAPPGAPLPPPSSLGPAGSTLRTFRLRNFKPIVGGDPAFAVPIGTSSAMLNKVGCLIGSVTMGVNYLLDKSLTPLDANEVGKRTRGAFNGANTDPTILGAAMGLDIPYRLQLRRATMQDYKKRIEETLRRGGVCIIHVDYDSVTPGGDPNGDHFIILLDQQGMDPQSRVAAENTLAALTDAQSKAKTPESRAALQPEINRLQNELSKPGGDFICADPAGGKFRSLNAKTLQGAGFGNKIYNVVGVLPVFRAGEAPTVLV